MKGLLMGLLALGAFLTAAVSMMNGDGWTALLMFGCGLLFALSR